MSQQPRSLPFGAHGVVSTPRTADVDTDAARKRAIRARCQALRPARMGPRDIRYVQANFLPLSDLVDRAGHDIAHVSTLIDDGLLPRPSYVLPDGTGMFPADHLAMWESADRAPDLPRLFRLRYESAASTRNVALAEEEVEEAWSDYLTGMYGVCLKQATPETILDKGIRTERIETLLAEPRPDDPGWLSSLHEAVDALDALERPFTAFDRRRFGAPTSRDRLITAVRHKYPLIVR